MATKKATKKAKARRATTKRAARKTAPPQQKPGSADPREVRRELVHSVLEEARDIIGKVIAQAKKGNYLPAKYLFEFAGIAEPLPEADGGAAVPHPSLAELLLATMQGDPVTKVADPNTEQPSVG